MSRLQRLDFHGAIHWVRIRGRDDTCIFFDPAVLSPDSGALPADSSTQSLQWPEKLRHFQRLAWAMFAESGVRVHGFVFEPNRGVLVLQTFGAPLHAIMRRVCGEYSRYLREQRVVPGGRSVFAGRYESRILAPALLPEAIRRVHRSPAEAGLVTHYAGFPFSSDGAYGRQDSSTAVETSRLRQLLAKRRFVGVSGYRRFMELHDNPHVAGLFDRGARLDPRIIGEGGYVSHARLKARRAGRAPTPERLIQTVAEMIGMAAQEIRSGRQGTRGRALVAWYATRTGAATSLAQVGRWFGVTGSALGAAIRHYRAHAEHSAYFNKPPDLLFDLDNGLS